MAFDREDFWENKTLERITDLELKKEKLELEIKKLSNPYSNRMLAEDLGTAKKGFYFQKMLFVLIQDEELITYSILEENNRNLTELTDTHMKAHNIYRIGDAFYKKRSRYEQDWNTFSVEEQKINIARQDKYIPTFCFSGRHFYVENDYQDYSNELLGEYIYYETNLWKGKPNGIYQVLAEGCNYGGGVDYWGEYDGGEVEFEYKFYDSIPLYEYLENKDDLISEARLEAEELAEHYIFIQQTIQKRFYNRTQKSFNHNTKTWG